MPLQKKNIEIGQPRPIPKELDGYDKQGNPIYWDPQPRVVPLGDGKYAFKWIGHTGRELTLIYQRPDIIDIIVESSAHLTPQNKIRYVYNVRNLESSKQRLGGFYLLAFSAGAQPETSPGIYATDPRYRRQDLPPEERYAFTFVPPQGKREVNPGQKVVFGLISPDLPGLVECRAHADTLMMKGVGEEPPGALEELYLRRDAWPHGYTIGPDERLGKMPLNQRVTYLVERLPEMLRLGWIENQRVMEWYKENLLAGKAAEVRARAEADFKRNLITSEVLALIIYLTW